MNLLVTMSGPRPVDVFVEPKRTWDWVDMRWDPKAPERGDYHLRVPAEKRKFEAFYWLTSGQGITKESHAIALVDDDVSALNESWSAIFDAFLATGMDVGMPALTQDSYCAHPITMRDPTCRWRKTNYLDIMCVLFTADGLRRHWDTFSSPREPWGIESVWAQRELARGKGIAILDETPIRHVRPINCDPARVRQALADARAVYERFGVEPIREHLVLERHT